MGPDVEWLDVVLAVACLLAGLHHLGLALGRRAPAVPSAGYAVMGFGMAAMFAPAVDPLPRAVWVAVFAASAAWFGVRLLRGGSLPGCTRDAAGHHTVGALAMLFMLLTPGHGSGLLGPAVALALAAWFLADIVRLLAHAAPVALPAPAAATAAGAPNGSLPPPPAVVGSVRGVPVACLVMDAAMAVMLVVMA